MISCSALTLAKGKHGSRGEFEGLSYIMSTYQSEHVSEAEWGASVRNMVGAGFLFFYPKVSAALSHSSSASVPLTPSSSLGCRPRLETLDNILDEWGAELRGVAWCKLERWSGRGEHSHVQGAEILTAQLCSHALLATEISEQDGLAPLGPNGKVGLNGMNVETYLP